MLQVVFSFFNLQGTTSKIKVSQQSGMKFFGEKLIEIPNVSYLGNGKLNFVDPDLKNGWSILGGPWTWSRWWSMDWGSVKCI